MPESSAGLCTGHKVVVTALAVSNDKVVEDIRPAPPEALKVAQHYRDDSQALTLQPP